MRRTRRRRFLAQEEELALIARAQAGDEQAVLRLVGSQQSYIAKLAKQWRIGSVGLDLEDLIEYGILGLLKAIRRYDPSHLVEGTGRPHRLNTFASRWITGEISLAIHQGMYTIRPRRDSYIQEHVILSLDEPMGCEDRSLIEVLPDPLQFEEGVLLRHTVAQALASMPNRRWAGLIRMRFGLDGKAPRAYHEMGKAYGICTNHARGETLRALKWLRKYASLKEATLQMEERR
jgi:RNA polymerase sigma factor (sigma-70 family)